MSCKIIFMLLILLCLNSKLWAANGSFLILKSVYLYNSVDKTGKKKITKRKAAYNVDEIHFDKNEKSLLFKLNLPHLTQEVNGSGFILENDQELQELGEKRVKVYSKLPKLGMDLSNHSLVPSQKLLFTGKKENSPDFSNLTWREVNFKIKISESLWAAEWAGIYRPDKTATWMNNTYQKVTKMKLKGDKLLKVLQGLVEVGFNKDLVLLSIDEPQKKVLSADGDLEEWIYLDRKIIMKDNRVQRIF
ncbi:MAG: hypothetical protein GY786_13130 [Proteobacteria bacterium]|nr:hypothetical protein [Pseudomonadota bacterium]